LALEVETARRTTKSPAGDRPVDPKHEPGQSALERPAYAERLIGSVRREALDHVVVFGERHLRHLLQSYAIYYNEARTHLSLNKDAPIPLAAQTIGRIMVKPHLDGLHHEYARI